jgi:hypothetical protein
MARKYKIYPNFSTKFHSIKCKTLFPFRKKYLTTTKKLSKLGGMRVGRGSRLRGGGWEDYFEKNGF